MRYNKKKNSEENLLKLNKNLVNSNIEKKNFKITSFFIYLINLLNNNAVKQHLYLDVSEKINFFKKDKKHLYFKFYYDNFKLLNKIRNNYFLFYLLNKNNSNTLNKLGLSVKNNKTHININLLNNLYLNNLNKKCKNIINRNRTNNSKFLSQVNYNDFLKYKNTYTFHKKFNSLIFYRHLLRNIKLNKFSNSSVKKTIPFNNNLKKLIIFNQIKYNIKINNKNLINFITKKSKVDFLHYYINDIPTSKSNNFYFNTNKKFGIGLFFQSFTSLKLKSYAHIPLNFKNSKNLLANNIINYKLKGKSSYNKN